jgi:hypothetical protein
VNEKVVPPDTIFGVAVAPVFAGFAEISIIVTAEAETPVADVSALKSAATSFADLLAAIVTVAVPSLPVTVRLSAAIAVVAEAASSITNKPPEVIVLLPMFAELVLDTDRLTV